MSSKIEVKICSQAQYRSIYELRNEREFSASDAADFLSKLPTYHVEAYSTILDLAKQIWDSENLTNHTDDTVYFENAEKTRIARSFHCFALNEQGIQLFHVVKRFAFNHKLILVYAEKEMRRRRTGRFPRYDPPWYTNYSRNFIKSYQERSINPLLVTTMEEGIGLSTFLRNHFYSLIAKNELYILEKPNKRWDKELLEFWDTQTQSQNELDLHSLFGYTRSRPYRRNELHKKLPVGVQIKKFPCIVFPGDLSANHFVIEIPERGWSKFFEEIFNTKVKVVHSILNDRYEWDFKAVKKKFLE